MKYINNLPIPHLLNDLVSFNRWKIQNVNDGFEELFKAFGDAKLYSFEWMESETKMLYKAKSESFIGVVDEKKPPGNIIPEFSVIIGDLGYGYDQYIVLDYRNNQDNPRVITLEWGKNPKTDNRWITIADSFDEFTSMIGISENSPSIIDEEINKDSEPNWLFNVFSKFKKWF